MIKALLFVFWARSWARWWKQSISASHLSPRCYTFSKIGKIQKLHPLWKEHKILKALCLRGSNNVSSRLFSAFLVFFVLGCESVFTVSFFSIFFRHLHTQTYTQPHQKFSRCQFVFVSLFCNFRVSGMALSTVAISMFCATIPCGCCVCAIGKRRKIEFERDREMEFNVFSYGFRAAESACCTCMNHFS